MDNNLTEIFVEHLHSHLFKNKLAENGIEFKVMENHTGNFSEPFQTFYVVKNQSDQAYKLLDNLSSEESDKAPIKHQWFYQGFMWVFTLGLIAVLVIFTNILLSDKNVGPEIWIAYVVTLILSGLGFYGMYKSGAFFGKLK